MGVFNGYSSCPWERQSKRADVEYPFEYGEVINCTLDSLSIHPVTKKIQAFFLTQLREWKEGHW